MKEFENTFLEKSIGTIEQIPKKTLTEIAISGKSNVGKSSLINAIISKPIAYTSKNAGKTILINFYRSKNFRLVDVPGYGFNIRSKDEKNRFNKLADDYFNLFRTDLVMHLVDFRHNLQENDSQMIKFLSEMKTKFCIVFTKIDKVPNNKYEQFFLNLKSQIDIVSTDYIQIFGVSSKTKKNINKLCSFIISAKWSVYKGIGAGIFG